ncbi:MAG: hypothetical protein HYX90_00595 [Chloroflexi bacterium]|nr:hypothetical protein [Chloroflexota bacterium]
MAPPTCAVLVFSNERLPSAVRLIERELLSGSRVTLITPDGVLPTALKGRVAAHSFDDYLTPGERDEVNLCTARYVAAGLSFFKDNPDLAPRYNGISLWDIILYPAFLLYVEVEKYARVTERILERERPDRLLELGARGDSLFWYNQGTVLKDSGGRLQKLSAWLLDTGTGTPAEWTAIQIANRRNIPAAVARANGRFSSACHRLFSKHVLPPAFRLFLAYSEARNRKMPASRAPGSGGERPICLVAQTKGAVQVIAPIARELARQGHEAFILSVDGRMGRPSRDALLAEGLPFSSYDHYINGQSRGRVAAGTREMLRLWRKLKRKTTFLSSLEYRGLPVGEIFEDRLRQVFACLFPEIIRHIEAANTILDKERPLSIVLVDDSSRMERSMSAVARLKGIPTVQTSYGLYATHAVASRTDRTAVWGEGTKRFLTENRLAPEHSIELTGNPGSGVMKAKAAGIPTEEIFAKLGIPFGKKVVLFCSQGLHYPITAENRGRITASVYRAAQELSDCWFVTKLHPCEGSELHHQMVRELGLRNVCITENANLYECFKACDVALAYFSGTALEAMVMDKPVVIVNMTGWPELLPYVAGGAALGATVPEDVAPAIRKALFDDETRSRLAQARGPFVLEWDGPQDGLAAQRVARLAIDMGRKYEALAKSAVSCSTSGKP